MAPRLHGNRGGRRPLGGKPPREVALARGLQQDRELREQTEKVLRSSVRRLVRAGLSDNQVSDRLHVTPDTVVEHRRALGLAANPSGGALD